MPHIILTLPEYFSPILHRLLGPPVSHYPADQQGGRNNDQAPRARAPAQRESSLPNHLSALGDPFDTLESSSQLQVEAAPREEASTAHSDGADEDSEYIGRFVGSGYWFILLLAVIFLYQIGLLLPLYLIVVYFVMNSSVMMNYRSQDWTVKLSLHGCSILASLLTAIFVWSSFDEPNPWLNLAFIPTKSVFTFKQAVFTVWMNEFLILCGTMLGKHTYLNCATRTSRSIKKKSLSVIEQVSKLYRILVPIPVWLLYLYYVFADTRAPRVFGACTCIIYLFFVALHVKQSLFDLIDTFEFKTPEEHCSPATQDDICKYNRDGECPICREEMSTRSPLRLPCEHVFCSECVITWFEKHASCPTCRKLVGADDIIEDSTGNTNIYLQENGIGFSVLLDD